MTSRRFPRVLAGLALAGLGIAFAILLSAPAGAALAAGLAGAAGAAWILAERPKPLPTPAEQPPIDPQPAALPDAEALIEGSDEPLLLVRNRRVLLANAAAREVLGPHIVGVDVRLAIRHPAAAELLTGPAPGQEEVRSTRTELVGLGEPDRRWMMTMFTLTDGSRLVRLTDRSEAHASEQMRTDFVANASHELRTPLATLLGFLETLQEEDAAADAQTRSRFLSIMFDEARRMHRLVDDLISLSRIEAERFSIPREPVPLLPLTEEVRASCAALAEARRSRIEIEATAEDPVVYGDHVQLVQLLQNLVVNAMKYGREGETVTIRFADEGDLLRMSVIDRGEGIEPEHLPRLTQRFYRVDTGRSRAVGGTGLGLAIVKHIVGRHRGRLEIESRRGEGTAVHVSLPKATDAMSSKSHQVVT